MRTLRRLLSLVGPFALALAPLLIAVGAGLVPSSAAAPVWPGDVVSMTTSSGGSLDSLAVLEQEGLLLTTYPVDLVVAPPGDGEVRALTLFATGQTDAIRRGLEVLLARAIPFYVVLDGFGTPAEHNLGTNVDAAIEGLEQATSVDAETRHIQRPDGSYSYLLDRSLSNAPGSLPQIDPERVFVRIVFAPSAAPDSLTMSTLLRQEGFNVERERLALGRPPGASFQYRLDPQLAEVVALAVDANVTVEPIGDLKLAGGADVLILLS